jgi:hypothetical protein
MSFEGMTLATRQVLAAMALCASPLPAEFPTLRKVSSRAEQWKSGGPRETHAPAAHDGKLRTANASES